MTIGSFTIIKNECGFIGPHLIAWLPHLDEMVFFDGDSSDGTTGIIEIVKNKHPLGSRITLVKHKDPKDFTEDYTKTFNDCLKTLKTDIAFYLHPDMFPLTGEANLRDLTGNAWFTHMRSYAGDGIEDIWNGNVLEITKGRCELWKNIMRLKNPDLGLHYYGAYGAYNEDMYFRAITGESHDFYGPKMDLYPYEIKDSACWIAHFSDVRPYGRRLSKMITSLMNQGYTKHAAEQLATNHPRVTLQNNPQFEFKKADSFNYPFYGIIQRQKDYSDLCLSNAMR